MITKEKKYITPEEYLKFERGSDKKHEYFKGKMFAMSGASFNNNMISRNMIVILYNKLKNTEYIAFGSDMRVYVSENGLYTYPDISVFKKEVVLQDEEKDTALNPVVLFEILSKATQNYDRGGKFKLYRDIPTLEDYVLISQDDIRIEHFSRSSDERWILKELKRFDDELFLNSINVNIRMSEIFEGLKM